MDKQITDESMSSKGWQKRWFQKKFDVVVVIIVVVAVVVSAAVVVAVVVALTIFIRNKFHSFILISYICHIGIYDSKHFHCCYCCCRCCCWINHTVAVCRSVSHTKPNDRNRKMIVDVVQTKKNQFPRIKYLIHS